MYDHKDALTDEELIKVLTRQDRCSSTSSDDHPDFKELRNELEKFGYIETQRSWWNGDRVLQSFKLNGAKFNKGEQFPCGAAIKYTVDSKLKGK
jgi:hypothetical protein